MPETQFEVTEHLTEENRGEYQIAVNGDVKAFMRFSRLQKLIILHHTEVKPFLRGTGAGKALLNYAASDARKRGLKLNAVCPFSRKSMEGNPDFADVYDSD